MKSRTFPLIPSLLVATAFLFCLPALAQPGPTSSSAAGQDQKPSADQQKPFDPLAHIRDAFDPKKTPNAEADAKAFAAKLLEASGADLGSDKEAQTRKDRVIAALKDWVLQDPEGAAKLQVAIASGTLSPEEKDKVLAFIKQAAGAPDQKTSLDNVSQLSQIAKDLQAKIEVAKELGTKEKLDKFFENIGVKYRSGPELTVPTSPIPKVPVVKESEIIRGFDAGDPYLYRDGAYLLQGPDKHTLALQIRFDPADTGSLYANLSDVHNSLDVRGQTFRLAPGGKGLIEFPGGQTYQYTVSAEKVKDPGAPGEERDDWVVRIFAVQLGKKGKVEKQDPVGTETMTVFGPEGLLARGIKKVVEGRQNEDGSRERYVVYLGEGANRRKFYASVGGVTPSEREREPFPRAGVVLYPAEQADRIYDAIMNRKPYRLSDLRPFAAMAVWESNNGQAVRLKGGSTVVPFAGQYYQYQWDDVAQAMILKKIPKPAPPKKEEAKAEKKGEKEAEGEEPAGGQEPQAEYPAVDPDWPAQIQGPTKGRFYFAKQSEVNKQLKELGVEYRIYEGYDEGAGKYFAFWPADKDKVIPEGTLKKRFLVNPVDPDSAIRVEGPALVVESNQFANFFDVKDPSKSLAQVSKVASGDHGNVNVKDVRVLEAALKALSVEEDGIRAVIDRVEAQTKKGEQFHSLQGDAKSLYLKMKGWKQAQLVWPRGAGEGHEKTKSTGSQKSSDEKVFTLSPMPTTPLQPKKGTMDPQIESMEGGQKLQLKSIEVRPEGVGLYVKTDWVKDPGDRYVRWMIFKPQKGKTKAGTYPNDFEGTGEITNPIFLKGAKDLKFKPLIVEHEDHIPHLVLRSDPKHPNAYAVFLLPFDENHKTEAFLGHVAYRGDKEPGLEGHEK